MVHWTPDAIEEQIQRGITVYRSNVYYLGDEAVRDHGDGKWTEIPEPEDEEGDEL